MSVRLLLLIGSVSAILAATGTACRERTRRLAEADTIKGRIIALSDSLLVNGGTDTIRFGRLGSGEIAVQRFWIENKTQKPRIILDTHRSCGCISLDFDNQPIAPGETRRMEIAFDSRGEYGWQLKSMTLILNEAEKPWRLLIEADVE